MKLLAIETATEACSVAVWNDGEVVERFELAPRRHAELVLPWADALLAEAGLAKSQLDAIACGRGPGGFTGVRLAVAITQGLGLALQRPVLAISSLATLALQADTQPGAAVAAAIDARMGEIYLAGYRLDVDGGLLELAPEHLVDPRLARLPQAPTWIGVGTGFDAEDGALRAALGDALLQFDASALPHAATLARLAAVAFERGEAIAPERLQPAYLRDKVAQTLAERGRT